jgi:hypothetical protein
MVSLMKLVPGRSAHRQQKGAPSRAPDPETLPWSLGDFIVAAGLFAFGLVTNITTVLNNAYSIGSTLYDSAIFQTIIWRSGWALKPAPSIDDVSFLNVHLSPINYLPNAFSYLMPIDRMSYYGLVYGVVYGLLLFVVFAILRRQYGGMLLPAAIGSVLLYLSGPVQNGQWEPHQEYASSLFMLWFFLAWRRGQLRLAIWMLVLNGTVREDCGVILALPLLLLAGYAWWRREPATETRLLAGLSLLLSVASFTVKLAFFHLRDSMTSFYYGSPPFGHLSAGLLEERLQFLLIHESFLWMPGLVLLVAAMVLRDPRLIFGWIAFFPYWLFNFFSKGDLNAALGSYKAFPFVVTLLWPAILALGAERLGRYRLGIVQMLLLVSATLTWENGEFQMAPPTGLANLINRWALQPETENAALYRAFESRLANGKLGTVRASMGVLALYPYSFPIWFRSQPIPEAEAMAETLDSLLWFAGDRDEAETRQWLARGAFPYRYHVIGTRILLATRLPPEQLSSFAGAIERSE